MNSKPLAIKCSSLKPQFDYLISKCKSIRQFQQIHAQIITQESFLPHETSHPQLCKLASFCAVSPHGNLLSYAKTIFDQQPNPAVQLYNSLIRGFSVSHNQPQEAIVLFLDMLRKGVEPNNMTFPFVIKACTVSSRTEFGIMVHTHVLKCGLESDLYVQSSLIKFYANAKCLGSAKRLFDVYPERDIVCWNSMIDAYVKSGEMELARVVFDQMPCKDVISWNSIINGYGIIGNLGEAKRLFDQMPERNLVSWNSMLAGYVKCGNVEDALNMFRHMPRRDVVSWNAMLACYAQNGKANETLALFDEMKLLGIRANETTVVSVLSAIGQLGALDRGSHLHLYISEQGIKINSIVGTALIDMYVKCGNIAEASYIFNSMESKDVLAWNTMIIGMGMHGHAEEAQHLFNQMQHEGVAPNDITFVAILGAFRHAGMTEEGQKLLSSMEGVYGVEPKVEHYGCVIDLLSRAGRLDEALDLTRNMPMEPNAYTWGALLGGCRIHGNANVAGEVGKRLLDLEPQHSGRYGGLSYAKRWDDARTTRKLMQANGVAKMPGLSLIELQEDVHSFMAGDHSHPE
ncbi:hypothetical protein Ccrd_002094 [Cynara cardunculus var. scolymus]|uniref:Pentatricopeptide repeat-containing protein n=1 Tax=Cynara cardunculus var. scolymus TaxID=59895 RepID=A0A103XS44_CYNCS|nr:hypothetical protein Ccrd_002094 [Cynara cardunculus var. scolymus]